MSTATLTEVTPTELRRVTPQIRRPARKGPARGPVARPTRTVPAPISRVVARAKVRSCRIEQGSAATGWRLTDRGIAVVLVLALMITMAAVVVVGLTAWQVTGADYATWSAAGAVNGP